MVLGRLLWVSETQKYVGGVGEGGEKESLTKSNKCS